MTEAGSLQKVEQELSYSLNRMLEGLTLSVQTLPECPAIKLMLVNPESIPTAITSQQFQQIWSHTAYWAFCWGSGQALARYILQNPDTFKHRHLIDFGCGSGVVAIAAAKVGAQVTACDIDPICKKITKLNCDLNNVQVNWCDDIYECEQRFDWLTAADVLYDTENIPWLDQFANFASQVIVADSRIKQWPATQYQLMATAQSNTVPDVGESEEFGHIRLWQWKTG